ncbi:hypothetical protein N0V86_006670 [Didymella sp. IMI 355093]|nr:hypothetical protein N0V86_006670 [Didymella sp. IMI 355093]
MPHPYPPAPTTPVTPDVSRHKLKQLAHWIRDDLDILVAREGPDILRPDDVLALHELFVALRQSTSITALDLRATGIHKAVKDIAGIATRWPRRLCDDCDKIITIWQSRFGRFEELHPFLYGRGGRLEGIASVGEYNNEVLLKRWSEYCPEKIHPRVSHRRGDLGFKAGQYVSLATNRVVLTMHRWWINSLFAHHAGIIGLESVEGGTTYDKNGSYALLLKDTGEIDARSEEVFTYRCPMNDKGKFRLTAATPTSREPIRVLRSHSINSIWGPKAGVRYEGLYSVTGWCVRQARLKDTMGGEWKEGDILFEVTMQRKDPTPMEQVTNRPTNMEMDDYAEYKRLRKVHREQKHKGPGPIQVPEQTLKAALPIPPAQLPAGPTIAPKSLLRASPSVPRQKTFREPTFDVPRTEADTPSAPDVVSPMTVPGLQKTLSLPKKTETLAVPAPKDKPKTETPTSSDATSREKYVQSPGSNSRATSIKSSHSELKEIIPWIDLEAELATSPAFNTPPVREIKKIQSKERLEVKAAKMNPVKNVRRLARDSRQRSSLSLQGQNMRDKDTATQALNLRLHSTNPILPILGGERGKETEREKEKEKKRPTFGKKARVFDGAGYSADEEDDDYQAAVTRHRRFRSSSVDNLPILHSPRPIKPTRPYSLFNYGIEHIEFTSPLDGIIPQPRAASPANSPTIMNLGGSQTIGESIALGKLRRRLSK